MTELDPAQLRRNRRIIWTALIASQLVYAAIVLSGIARDEPFELAILPIALAVVALGTAVGAHLCWRRATGAGQPIHSAASDPARSFALYLLAWVLDESIAIYGFVVGLLAYPAAAWAPFSVAALALALLHRPVDRALGGPLA